MHDFPSDQDPPRACRDGPLLLVVEGANDVLFLKHLSRLAQQVDFTLPDLAALEQAGRVIFIPFGGGNVLSWCERLAPLGCPEFHLLDREFPPETATREQAINRISSRSRCRGFLTRMPTAEHYLLPTLAEFRPSTATAVDYELSISQQIAATWHLSQKSFTRWQDLPIRKRHRYIQRAKGWLYSHVLPRMTLEYLQVVDRHGEILRWFEAIRNLLSF